jgi:hypothetical protein
VNLFADPSDDTALEQIQDGLVVRLTEYLERKRAVTSMMARERASNVMVAIEWKWRYGDGHLDRWSSQDVMSFLFEWCPRHLSVRADESDFALEALLDWLGYLTSEGLFDRVRESAQTIVQAIESARQRFAVAMADPSQYGPAKSLVMSALDAGVDLEDEAQVNEFIGDYNNRITSGRDAPRSVDDVSSDHSFGTRLLPVEQPTDAAIAASISEAPVLSKFRDLAAFVGPGRKLTQKGNLTLADARTLVELLQTGDEMEHHYGNRVSRTSSSAELRTLSSIVEWAKKAGFIRVLHGKLVSTKRGAALAHDLSSGFLPSVEAILALGPCSIYLRVNSMNWFRQLSAIIDSVSVQLLALPYVSAEPVPLETVALFAADMVVSGWSFRTDEKWVRQCVSNDVIAVIDSFVLCGLVRREGEVSGSTWQRASGGSVSMTPAGTFTARRLLIAAGFEAPIAGRFVEVSALELIRSIELDDFEDAFTETMTWYCAREPAAAMDELVAALDDLDDPVMENYLISVLVELDLAEAEPRLRSLRLNPSFAGMAAYWMREYGLIEESELYDPDSPFDFVATLVLRMIHDGPDVLLETLALVGDHSEQAEFVATIWRAPSQATMIVLVAISKLHANKLVSKAARKSSFKRESAQMNPRR